MFKSVTQHQLRLMRIALTKYSIHQFLDDTGSEQDRSGVMQLIQEVTKNLDPNGCPCRQCKDEEALAALEEME